VTRFRPLDAFAGSRGSSPLRLRYFARRVRSTLRPSEILRLDADEPKVARHSLDGAAECDRLEPPPSRTTVVPVGPDMAANLTDDVGEAWAPYAEDVWPWAERAVLRRVNP
jgi:hypothetical protein